MTSLGIILWNLNRIFDGLDGVVARIHKKQTKFGGILDLYIDFIVQYIFDLNFKIYKKKKRFMELYQLEL